MHSADTLPDPGRFDWLIVMGGPMSAADDAKHPWLVPEKRLIGDSIHAGKVVLGICLGAQLIASALGARVYPQRKKEIGWFPVRHVSAPPAPVASLIPDGSIVFHWHGDTFDIPRGAIRLLRSDSCENQAFALGDRVLGLQFHLETTALTARDLIDNCRAEIVPDDYVQTEEVMLGDAGRFPALNGLMSAVLDSLPR